MLSRQAAPSYYISILCSGDKMHLGYYSVPSVSVYSILMDDEIVRRFFFVALKGRGGLVLYDCIFSARVSGSVKEREIVFVLVFPCWLYWCMVFMYPGTCLAALVGVWTCTCIFLACVRAFFVSSATRRLLHAQSHLFNKVQEKVVVRKIMKDEIKRLFAS